MNNIVALITDFGTDDGSVACMEAVILSKNPNARIIHISHTVPGWEISVAAMFLEVYYRYYPRGTVFCAVIDPGVGTERKPIAIDCEKHFFVGPDNGIFTRVIEQSAPKTAVQLDRSELWLENVSTTFHGRDIFAPVAGHLAQTQHISHLGTRIPPESLVKLEPFSKVENDTLFTEVLFIDCWGNMVIGAKKEQVQQLFADHDLVVTIRGTRITNQVKTFSDLPKKELGLIFGGDFGDYGTIAMNMGNAAQETAADLGETVKIKIK